ncbi:hypothetical protein JHW43_009203, partial [Diplocarpon mali]
RSSRSSGTPVVVVIVVVVAVTVSDRPPRLDLDPRQTPKDQIQNYAMKPCSWDRVLVQLFLLAASATRPSAAAPPFANPSAAHTTRIFTQRAAYSSDLHFTHPTFSRLLAGAPVNITWTGASGPSLLTVHGVDDDSFSDANIIAGKYLLLSLHSSGPLLTRYTLADITVSSLVWIPPADTDGVYHSLRLKDQLSGTVVYSDIFQIIVEGEPGRGTGTDSQSRLSIVPREPAPSHPEISTSAKIWVGVGSALIVVSVIGGIVGYQYFCRREQRKLLAVSTRRSSSDLFFREEMSQVEAPEKVYVRPKEYADGRTGLQ